MNKKLLILLAMAIPFLTMGTGCATKVAVNPTDNTTSSTTVVATSTNPYEQKLSFATQINQSLQNGSSIKEIENPILTLPTDINAGQIKKYFKMNDILFALVLRESMNVRLSLPTNFTPSFVGVIVANQSDTGWTKLVEIKDATTTDENNPYYLMVDNKKLLLTVVDQHGGGSGEGIMKVFALAKTNDWSLVGCYYFGSYNDPEVDGDYFAFSTKFSKQTKQPMKSCNNVQLISI